MYSRRHHSLSWDLNFWIGDDLAWPGLPFPLNVGVPRFTPGISLIGSLKAREVPSSLFYFSSSRRLAGMSGPPSPLPSALEKLPARETQTVHGRPCPWHRHYFQAPGMKFSLHCGNHCSTSGLKIQHTTVSFTTENLRLSKEAVALKIAMLS